MANWFHRFLASIGGAGLREAILPPSGGGIDSDEHLFRSLTSRVGAGDLAPYQHDKMLEVALYLDRKNPVASRMLDLLTDFVFGEGISFKAHNAQVHEVLERHWGDPLNRWDLRGPRLFRALLRDGEVLLTSGVNPVDGMVRWGRIPAQQIKTVEVDPLNWEITRRVILYPERAGDPDRAIEAINQSLETGRLEGMALYWKLNDDGKRGISLLYALADLLDLLEQGIFNDAEREMLMKSFLFDVTVRQADANEIARLVREDPQFQPPRPGSVRVHNENVEWQVHSPDLRGYESVNGHKFRLNLILGSVGIPEHWYGMGGDVNRAVGTVMDEPTIKMLTRLQNLWRELMTDALRFVLDQAVLAGTLPASVPREDQDGQATGDVIDPRDAFEVVTPDMSTTDIQQTSAALAQVALALTSMTQSHWVSSETAQQAVWLMLSQLGVEIDAEREADLIAQEKAEAERKKREMFEMGANTANALTRAVQPPQSRDRLAPVAADTER